MIIIGNISVLKFMILINFDNIASSTNTGCYINKYLLAIILFRETKQIPRSNILLSRKMFYFVQEIFLYMCARMFTYQLRGKNHIIIIIFRRS